MAKKLSEAINKEIIDFTVCLTEVGLEISNNYPSTKQMLKKINDKRKKRKSISKTITKITPAVADENHKVIFDNELEYIDLYKELEKDKNYNVKLVDGALISLTYEIDEQDKKILTHRLTFFPSPSLFAFEDNRTTDESDGYEELYSDIISKNIYPFPIRFDYDFYNSIDVEHPKSHLTLGQYKNCRIPVTSAVTPGQFLIFILRNFYSTFYNEYEEKFNTIRKCDDMESSITERERCIPHFVIN